MSYYFRHRTLRDIYTRAQLCDRFEAYKLQNSDSDDLPLSVHHQPEENQWHVRPCFASWFGWFGRRKP